MTATATQLIITNNFSDLVTKFNIVSSDLGATDSLTTTAKNTIVASINEIDALQGNVTLGTTASTVTGAIAEIEGVFDASAFGISAGSNAFDITTTHATGISLDAPKVNLTGNLTLSGTVDGRDVAADGTKLDTVETNADVTDTTNVTLAGALMDSELADIASVKALNQSLVSGATPTFGTANFTDATNKRFMTDSQETKLDGVESGATADQTASEILTLLKTVDTNSSGLNADTLDGVQGASYLRSDVNDTYTGDLTLTGTIALSSHLDMPDNAQVKIGNDDDLVILHDATHSIIKGDSIRIKSNSVDETMASFTKDGEVNLYHNNISRLATTATGVSIPQNLELGASSLISGGGNTAITLSNANVTISGTLSVGSLDTSNQTVRVAINELHTDIGTNTTAIGTLSSLSSAITVDRTNLVAAINELQGDITQINTSGASANNTIIGTLGDLETSTQANIVAAINEIEGVFDASDKGISAGTNAFNVVSGAFGINASGAITLDATGDIVLKDASEVFTTLTNDNGNLILKSGTTTALSFNGANVVPAGTVDGRDIAADGTKLDGISPSADVNRTDAQIKTSIGTGNGKFVPSVGTSGHFLKHDGTFGLPPNTEYSTATSSTLGLVKIGYTENGKNYPVELSSGQMFVNVPWDIDTDTNTQNTYSTSVVSSSGIKLRLTGAGHDGATTDDVKFVGAGSSTVSRTDASTITITSTDTNTQLSNEQVQDIVGGMLGGTETGITVTYQDGTGDIDFVVASQTDNNFTTALKNKLDGIASNLNAFVEPTQALTTTATTVADAINELKAAIPLVFNASGTQLN